MHCRNMVRAVTFWYTKELSTFENNEDLPSPKIDVTRYTEKKVSDILAGDGDIANLFLQCKLIKIVFGNLPCSTHYLWSCSI